MQRTLLHDDECLQNRTIGAFSGKIRSVSPLPWQVRRRSTRKPDFCGLISNFSEQAEKTELTPPPPLSPGLPFCLKTHSPRQVEVRPRVGARFRLIPARPLRTCEAAAQILQRKHLDPSRRQEHKDGEARQQRDTHLPSGVCVCAQRSFCLPACLFVCLFSSTGTRAHSIITPVFRRLSVCLQFKKKKRINNEC